MTDLAHDDRMRSPSVARNRDPILAAMRRSLPATGKVLEIASGTGEHAAYLAAAMPGLDWQPSDPDPASRVSIASWISDAPNVCEPLAIDASTNPWGVEDAAPFDVVVSINIIHISPWSATLGLFAGAGRVLGPNGRLFLYGPFKRNGRHTAPSNEAFDASLRARNPAWGVRDIADLVRLGELHHFVLHDTIEMPTNNLSLVFVRAAFA